MANFMEEVLIYFHLKNNGDWHKIAESLQRKEQVDYLAFEELKIKYPQKFIAIISEEYPKEYKEMINPPFVLSEQDLKNIEQRQEEIRPISEYYQKLFGKGEYFDGLGNVTEFGTFVFGSLRESFIEAQELGLIEIQSEKLDLLEKTINKKFLNDLEIKNKKQLLM